MRRKSRCRDEGGFDSGQRKEVEEEEEEKEEGLDLSLPSPPHLKLLHSGPRSRFRSLAIHFFSSKFKVNA